MTEEPDADTLGGPFRGVGTTSDLVKPCAEGPCIRVGDAAAAIEALTLSIVVAIVSRKLPSEARVVDCAAARGVYGHRVDAD